ncbi:uncharacterized protein LOC125577794 [Brassica napus]|uniref:uncharacterized protein LOC125577794 n=1 Tax=Brassica napus TaxID=3708 RepID=UPI002078FB2A|nr:uncharacterized protein LOC125577794 [Brassica napus]
MIPSIGSDLVGRGELIGFPLHLWTDTNLRNTGGRLGHVDTLELTEGRMLIEVDSRRPLKFSRKVEYEGDEVTIEIKYDKLFKHCTICGLLSHEKGYCPLMDVRSWLQHVERPDVFSRLQRAQDMPRQNWSRDALVNARPSQQSSLQNRELQSSRYYTSKPVRYDDKSTRGQGPRYWENDSSRGRHSDRIIRSRDDHLGRNRYGRARDNPGPYARPNEKAWKVKPKTHEVGRGQSAVDEDAMIRGATSVEDEEGLVAIATSYFRQIFESSNPEDIEEALAQVPTTITGAMNENLTAPVTEWEVKLALFAMHPEKAPGPDGMTALFYQKFWDIVKDDLTLMVNNFLIEGTVVNGLNDTNICLIPKTAKPNDMAQFRPISLCNVSYKIISKVLCQRLKKVLPGLISETQSAFVAGRQISDNIMIAQEMFHALRTKPSGRSKRMAIKTDMSKAYDRMEWSFIEAVMRKMGFSETWITWIMRCITSRINANTRQEIKDAMGIQNEGGMGTYLGIPEDISGSKCKLFAFLKDKLMHRVNGWTGRWLSKGGKEVLIKSILLALPTYVMSTFLLPLEICENLASAIARFWWSSNPPKRGIHWVKWEKVCLLREEGEIGFRMIHEFNLALLAKQLWRLVQFPDSLVGGVLKGRYYRLTSPLRVNSASCPSYVWTSISAARKLLLLGIRQKVHSGYEVKVWEDPWIPTIPARPDVPVAPVMHPNMRVSDLIDQVGKEWDVGLLENYVNPEDIPLIRSLAISSSHRRDTFCWSYTRNGQYSVKSGYWVAQNLLKMAEAHEILEPSITKLQAFAWKLKAPTKICHLIWQLLTGHVAVTRNLVRRNMRCDNYCPRCGELEESVTHAIFECPPALQAWTLSATPTSPEVFPLPSVYANMEYLFWRKNSIIEPEQDRDPFPWIIWYIWKARNDKLFKGIDRDPLELVLYAESECQVWFDANDVAQPMVQETNIANPQVISLGNICLLDGSWTTSANFSGLGWVWMDNTGNTQLMGMKNLPRRESALHSEVEALRWAMENMLQHSTCQRFGTDCKELIAMLDDPHAWPSFATELEG